jgi:multiple sugar transport system permease protein
MSEAVLSVEALASEGEAAAVPRDHTEAKAAFGLVLPALVLMLVLLVMPTAAVIALSFTDAELGASQVQWLGLQAYADLLHDRTFLRSATNTALYVAMVAPASVLLGLGAALLIEAEPRLRAFFRAAYFLPVVSLLVAMATVWQYLMHPTIGPINLMLRAVGLPGVNWLGSSDNVLAALALIGIWQQTGFNMVLFLAGLTGVNRELYAAAEVDGVRSGWERFRLVTWPMLGPTTLFVVTISIINAVKVFETVATLTQGGPSKASEVLLWTIYQEGFVYLHVGAASAMAVVFIAVLTVLLLLQTKALDKRVHYT